MTKTTTMTTDTCPRCKGPNDDLHTPVECDGLRAAAGIPELDRYDLNLVAAIINESGHPMVAAMRLNELGWLRQARA